MNPFARTLPHVAGARSWLLAAALWLLIAVPTVLVLWQLRENSLQTQERELDLLCLALADKVERGLMGVEEGVIALRDELQRERLPQEVSDLAGVLSRRTELMPLVTRLWLVDRQGRPMLGTDAAPPPAANAFTPAPVLLSPAGVSLSRPFAGVMVDDVEVALAMDLHPSTRIASGWLVAGVSTRQWLGAFGRALGDTDLRVAVQRSDGTPLAGTGIDRLSNDPSEAMLLPHAALQHTTDTQTHLVSQRMSARYGLTVVVSRHIASVLESWRTLAALSAAGLLMLMLIMASAVRFSLRSAQLRDEAHRLRQTQLARASKLEALGTLAGGVAHDFNGVLAGIQGWGEMALESAAPGGEQARQLGNALRAVERGRALVERVLVFSRGGAQVSRVFEVEPLVQEALTLLSGSKPENIVLEADLRAPGAHLRGDPNLLYEAVMNLCTNAMQAMPRGGRLGVQLEQRHVPEPRVLSHSRLAAGSYLVLTVYDQGTGITGDVMERLFEPFFTTRSAQRGTGLGLAMVRGVVTELHGAIGVYSVPGMGSRFTMYLPECHEPLSPEGKLDEPAPHAP